MNRFLIGAIALAILALIVLLRRLKRGIDITNNDDHHRG